MKIFNLAICTFLLSALLACHSDKKDDPPPLAKTLHYTENPEAKDSAWRLVQHSGNGTTHIVFKVMGPVGVNIRGAAFAFTADAGKVTWGTFEGTPGAAPEFLPGKVLDFTQATPSADVQLLKSKVDATKGELQVGAFQKQGVVALSQEPLGYVSLRMKEGARVGKATFTASSKCMHLKGDEKIIAPETVKFLLGTLELR